MMKKIVLYFSALLLGLPMAAHEARVAGPDGRLVVTVSDEGGKPAYSVTYDGVTFLEPSPLGLKADIGDFTEGLLLSGFTEDAVAEDYSVPTIKFSTVHYRANRGIFRFVKVGGADGEGVREPEEKVVLELEMQVSANDVAFRYRVPAPDRATKVCRVLEEATGYVFPEGTTSFLCPQMPPMAGFARTTPSYETAYTADDSLGKNGDGYGYVFPGLFRRGDKGWILLSETGVHGNYCGGRLIGHPDGSFRLGFPMEEEFNGNGTVTAGIPVPGYTPWRTITIGTDLKPIAETTVAWDVVEPQYAPSKAYSGSKGSWSWIIKMDDSIDFDTQKEYVDFSAAMGWQTVLVDNWWDTRIGRERIEELAAYARTQGVQLCLWYNSNGYWNDAPQGPRDIMDRSITRRREMQWMQSIGIRGIKVDFFGSDKQQTMQLYEDILADANDFGLVVVFHGCTLPRGWERMYPNFASAEAVLASENLHFTQVRDDTEAFHACLHPFIRNAVASMDFGGSTLNKVYNATNDPALPGTVRRTSDVFALATAVLFQSPVQHFAMAPNNLTDAPQWAVDFMKDVPTQWDEIRFIDGYPGRYVVLARRSGDTWYTVGINASAETRTVTLDLPAGEYTLYSDMPQGRSSRRKVRHLFQTGPDSTVASFPSHQESRTHPGGTLTVQMPCNGGFVIVQ